MEIVGKRKRHMEEHPTTRTRAKTAPDIPDDILDRLEGLRKRLQILRGANAPAYMRIYPQLENHRLTIRMLHEQLQQCVGKGNTVAQIHAIYMYLEHRFLSVMQGIQINTRRASFSTIPFQEL